MKITKSQLKQIIKEELGTWSAAGDWTKKYFDEYPGSAASRIRDLPPGEDPLTGQDTYPRFTGPRVAEPDPGFGVGMHPDDALESYGFGVEGGGPKLVQAALDGGLDSEAYKQLRQLAIQKGDPAGLRALWIHVKNKLEDPTSAEATIMPASEFQAIGDARSGRNRPDRLPVARPANLQEKTNLKITKSQLKQIIKEELESVLSEAFPGRSGKRLPGQRTIPVRKTPEEESKAQQMLRRKKQSSSTTAPRPEPRQTQEPKTQPAQKSTRKPLKKANVPLKPTALKRNNDGSWTATVCAKEGNVCGEGTYKSKITQTARSMAAALAEDNLVKKLKN